MKLHHLLVVAILGGFFVFTFAVGCSNSPTEPQFAQEDGESWTAGDNDVTITKKAVKKKTKRKATHVYKGRVKKKATTKTTGKGIGHVTYKKKVVKKKAATQETYESNPDAPFSFGVLVQDLKGITSATLNIGDADDNESWRIAYLYMTEDYERGTDANSTTGLLVRGELTPADLVQSEISVEELAEYLAMGEVFINIATLEYPGGEIAGQLMEVDMTPLMKKFEKK